MSSGADFGGKPAGASGETSDAYAAGAAEVLARLEGLRVALIRIGGPDRRITAWEGAAEDVFGFSAAEALGSRPEELPIAAPAVALRLREILLSRPEAPLEHDLHLLRKDGTAFPARVRSTLDFAADGSVAGSCALVLDTSSGWAPGDALPTISSLGPVAGLGTLAIGGVDREDLVERAVAIVIESLAIEIVGVFALDAEAGALVLEGGQGWAETEGGGALRIPLISPELVAILRTGRSVVVSDGGGRDLLPDGILARSRACDGLSVPIGDPFQPTGALVAFSAARRTFSKQEIEFLQATSHVLSAAWERERSRALEMRFQRLSRIEAMGQLTGGIAHDFNNLLAVILNHASFTRENLGSAADGAAGQSLDEIETAATRAAELTHQLLVFSRQDVVDVQPVDVAAAVASAERMLARTVGDGIVVETELERGLRPIEAGPGQIEQIVVNLVVNARDAMPDGGRVRIAVDRAGRSDAGYRWIRITVSDDGVGMGSEVIEKAFEPFFTTKPVGEGSGLGLATVYGIVSGLGGSIELASEPGEGTHVDILLPVADAAEEVEQGPVGAEPPPRAPEPEPARRRRLLLVEDDAMVRRLTTRVLSEGGYDVLVAEDPAAALELVRSSEGRVEVVLTDVVMPGMSGVELAQRLRELLPGICVVFMSGYTGDSVSREAVRDFEAGFVEKPFTPETLLAGVAAAFERV